MELIDVLKAAVEQGGSDIFIIPGAPVTAKIGGKMLPLTEERLSPCRTADLIHAAYALAGRDDKALTHEGDDDFSFSVKELSRFRCNAYWQRGTLAAALRVVTFGLPEPEKLHIPQAVMKLSELRGGMVLVTGPAGSGKSTTLSCLVDRINSTRSGHIVTIEDPIEYLHPHKCSLVSQREVPGDAATFDRALRAALRQAPDVIMLGEMRDQETIRIAITAAETGHLLFSSLHTVGAAKTVDRIVDVFEAAQQPQIRLQLSMALKAVVSQRLVPLVSGEMRPVFEVMTVNPAVQNLIRDGRTHQIDNVILSGGHDMLSMDAELLRLFKQGLITRGNALAYAVNPEALSPKL